MDVAMVTRVRREQGQEMPALVWRFGAPVRAIASSPLGGGIGMRRWIINAQVPPAYGRRDPERHLAQLGVSFGLAGRGIGMLTAADIGGATSGIDSGVEVWATVGLGHPILASAPPAHGPAERVGTINIVVVVPARLSDAALVNTVATVTEAKAQGLADLGLRATGTATDAVCVLCPDDGPPSAFGGPRSVWGARVARAVHRAVVDGGRVSLGSR